MFRFIKVEINPPKLYLRCHKEILNNQTTSLPCSSSAAIMDFEDLKFIDYCDWTEHEYIVSCLNYHRQK